MQDTRSLVIILSRAIVNYLGNKVTYQRDTSTKSTVFSLIAPVPTGKITERGIRRALSNLDFGADERNEPITIIDLDVRSFKMKLPFGAVATQATAVLILSDSAGLSLPLRFTLSTEFAGFEIFTGK